MQLRLLAIGDSIIAGVGASELSKALVGRTAEALAASTNCHVSWQALGASGYDTTKVLERLVPQLPDGQFDYVIVSVGVNDITGLSSVRTWRRNLSLLIRGLRAHSPEALIAFAGIPPLHAFPLLPQPLRAVLGLRGSAFDDVLRTTVTQFANTLHIPLDFEPDPDEFADDGYHPSEKSYIDFGRHMADGLLALMDASSARLQDHRVISRSRPLANNE